MVRATTYRDLSDEGERLRQLLLRRQIAEDDIERLAREVRVWQLRCAVAVAVRNPRLVADFRAKAGDLQRLVGRDWAPEPDWQARLMGLVSSWLNAIAWAEQ
ncbi:MAG TPA: hypothetical protein VKR24_08895 [Candidatus Limnocylindrales bacterium]|nr:hypothetical protein [Candidatus Limnocylindrales bacterium]